MATATAAVNGKVQGESAVEELARLKAENEILRLRAENAELEARTARQAPARTGVRIQVAEMSGGISLYIGGRRMPLTAYVDEWEQAYSDEAVTAMRAFLAGVREGTITNSEGRKLKTSRNEQYVPTAAAVAREAARVSGVTTTTTNGTTTVRVGQQAAAGQNTLDSIVKGMTDEQRELLLAKLSAS